MPRERTFAKKRIKVDKEIEASTTQKEEIDSSSSDVSATILRYDSEGAFLYSKPTIEYYRTAAGAFNTKHIISLSDARIGDVPQGTTWKKMTVTLGNWGNEESKIQKFFPKVRADKEVEIDLDKCRRAISNVFIGGKSFYDYQENYFPHITERKKNMVVSLPTGGGKSILFQGPALYRGSKTNRLTIVVTPLKALMTDQVQNLWKLNFWGSVETVSGDLSQIEVRDIYRRMAGGQILLLYITPERFRSRSFITALTNRIEVDGDLEYCVFDEAHCISQWGNEFRPAFLNAAKRVRLLQKEAKFFPCLFFSATLSEKVFDDLKNLFS